MRNLLITSKEASISINISDSRPAQTPEYSAPLIQIKAKISEEKISYLMDSFICSEIKAQKNGWMNVTFTAPDTPWLCEILLSLGPQIKIQSPARLKNKIAEMAEMIKQKENIKVVFFCGIETFTVIFKNCDLKKEKWCN